MHAALSEQAPLVTGSLKRPAATYDDTFTLFEDQPRIPLDLLLMQTHTDQGFELGMR